MASSKTALEEAQTHAASKDETRALLTELYERLTEEGRGPDLASKFARTNKEQGAPLDKHEISAFWKELHERDARRKLYPAGITAAELMGKVFAPVRWIVPDILPEGVTLLSGKAKMGKSWLALGWCVAVATGGAALGKKRVEQGEALYLALEDNHRRVRNRLVKVLAGEKAPDGLHIYTEWPSFDVGGADALDYWLSDHPNTRLVTIDTLKKVRPRERSNKGMYDLDYEALEPLLPIAAEHGVSILVVHHNNKMADPTDPFDVVSGSTGLTGGVDGVLILNRERGKADAFLYVDGRDIEDQGQLPLRWDANVCSWTLADGEPIEYTMSDERRSIFEALPDHGAEGIGPKAIADTTGMKPENVRYLLGQMVKDGEAENAEYGKYTKPAHTPYTAHGPHTPHSPHTSDGEASVRSNNSGPHTTDAQNSPIERSVSGVSDVRETQDVPPPIKDGCEHDRENGGCLPCRRRLDEEIRRERLA